MITDGVSTDQISAQLEDATGLTADFVVDHFQLTHHVVLRILQCAVVRHGTVIGDGSDRTGLFVWSGAKAFCACIAALYDHRLDGALRFDLTSVCSGLLELGGGVGLGALSVATLWRGLECWTTDAWGPALDMAVKQTQLNASLLNTTQSTVRAAFLDWHWLTDIDIASCITNDTKTASVSTANLVELTAPEFIRIACGGGLGRQPWIVGLDIVYPDHLDSNLMALFSCVKAALLARRLTSMNADRSQESLFTQFTMSFVDRDVGATLRRMLLAASVCELMVLPLSSPFHPVATRFADTAAVLVKSTFPKNDDAHARTHASALWSALKRHVLCSVESKSLGLRVCGSGEWMLSFSLAPVSQSDSPPSFRDHAGALAQLSRIVEGTVEGQQFMEGCWWSAPWVAHVPWLWPTAAPAHWEGPLFTANHIVKLCNVQEASEDDLAKVCYALEENVVAHTAQETLEDATTSMMMMMPLED